MAKRPEEELFGRDKVAGAIAQLRAAAKLTMRKAAKRGGITQSEWSMWENGERRPELDGLARVLRGCGADLHAFADIIEGERQQSGGAQAGDVLAVIGNLQADKRRLEAEVARLADYTKHLEALLQPGPMPPSDQPTVVNEPAAAGEYANAGR